MTKQDKGVCRREPAYSEKHRNGNAVRDFKRYVKTENSRNPQHIQVYYISCKPMRLSQKLNFSSMPKGIQQEVRV